MNEALECFLVIGDDRDRKVVEKQRRPRAESRAEISLNCLKDD